MHSSLHHSHVPPLYRHLKLESTELSLCSSDFSPFGGWSSPAIKQYDGTNDLCGFGVDSNWYPDSLSRNGTVKTA